MSGYLQRMALSAIRPGGKIHPIIDSVFSGPKPRIGTDAPQMEEVFVTKNPDPRGEAVLKSSDQPPTNARPAPHRPPLAAVRGTEPIGKTSEPPFADETPPVPVRPLPLPESEVPSVPPALLELEAGPVRIKPPASGDGDLKRPPKIPEPLFPQEDSEPIYSTQRLSKTDLSPVPPQPSGPPTTTAIAELTSMGSSSESTITVNTVSTPVGPDARLPGAAVPALAKAAVPVVQTAPPPADPKPVQITARRVVSAPAEGTRRGKVSNRPNQEDPTETQRQSTPLVLAEKFSPLVGHPAPVDPTPPATANARIEEKLGKTDPGRQPNPPVHEPEQIEIHIGRIEVTAVQPFVPVVAAGKPRRRTTTLDEYLRRRDGNAG